MVVKVGSEFLVNTTTLGYQGDPKITALNYGRFVVAWVDTSETNADAYEPKNREPSKFGTLAAFATADAV